MISTFIAVFLTNIKYHHSHRECNYVLLITISNLKSFSFFLEQYYASVSHTVNEHLGILSLYDLYVIYLISTLTKYKVNDIMHGYVNMNVSQKRLFCQNLYLHKVYYTHMSICMTDCLPYLIFCSQSENDQSVSFKCLLPKMKCFDSATFLV